MIYKIMYRLKQGLNYFFSKPIEKEKIREIKSFLEPLEYQIFSDMDRYDKIHSARVFFEVKDDELLWGEKTYLKLALLHDCGKESMGVFKRVKKVIFSDKLLEKHSILGYEKLKNINLELAKLVLVHHGDFSSSSYTKGLEKDNEDIKKIKQLMERFQEIDDKN